MVEDVEGLPADLECTPFLKQAGSAASRAYRHCWYRSLKRVDPQIAPVRALMAPVARTRSGRANCCASVQLLGSRATGGPDPGHGRALARRAREILPVHCAEAGTVWLAGGDLHAWRTNSSCRLRSPPGGLRGSHARGHREARRHGEDMRSGCTSAGHSSTRAGRKRAHRRGVAVGGTQRLAEGVRSSASGSPFACACSCRPAKSCNSTWR